jgi:hypothetical protein
MRVTYSMIVRGHPSGQVMGELLAAAQGIGG